MYLVKWTAESGGGAELIHESVVESRCPHLVIAFYRSRVNWTPFRRRQELPAVVDLTEQQASTTTTTTTTAAAATHAEGVSDLSSKDPASDPVACESSEEAVAPSDAASSPLVPL